MKEIVFKLQKIEFDFDKTITAELYGRSQDNKKVCLVDSKVYDYLIFDITDYTAQKRTQFIEDIKKNFKETKTEIFDAEIHDNPKKLLKIYTQSLEMTENIIEYNQTNKDWQLEAYEHDLPFERKYLLEKHIKYNKVYIATYDPRDSNQDQELIGDVDKLDEMTDASVTINPDILYFDIETYDDGKSGINMNRNPIQMISIVHVDYKKTLVAKPYTPNKTKDETELFASEKEMLQRFSDVVKELNPDAICGYNIKYFDLPYIIKRCAIYDIKLDIGAYFSEPFELKTKGKYDCKGLLIFDIYMLMKNIFRTSISSDSLSLDAVSEELLSKNKDVVSFKDLAAVWRKEDITEEDLAPYITYCMKDTYLCKELYDYLFADILEFQKMLNVNLNELTNLSFSQIVEYYLLLHAHEYNQIIPPRPNEEAIRERSNRRIKGAFVFDPIPGFYENIAVFDFTSLYPTIIEAHNITRGTITLTNEEHTLAVPEQQFFIKQATKDASNNALKKAYIPTVIENIITRRMTLKKRIKEEPTHKDVRVWKSRLQTLKLIANSLYGYLAFYLARWYSFEAAESVTAFGRYYIKGVIKTFEDKNLKVIYSDTDSIFVLSSKEKLGEIDSIVEHINSTLPGLMTLEKEEIYTRGIFVGQRGSTKGAKKKYALINKNNKFKIVGMAMVRGDWSIIARRIQKEVLHILLKENDVEKAITYVKKEVKELGQKDVNDFIISTKLKKPVDDYESRGPHVVVAQKMIDKGEIVRPGKVISYVITKGSSKVIGERAKLPEDVKIENVDTDYYINNQILPVLDGIFDVFGKDIAQSLDGKNKDLSSWF